MAGGASSLPLKDGLPCDGVARSFLRRLAGPEILHECNHLPHFVVGGAHHGHLGAGYSIAYGVEQIPVRAAPAVSASGEIGATAAFAARTVAVGTVNLKQSGALLHTFRCVESVDSILRPNGGGKDEQADHSRQVWHVTGWKYTPLTGRQVEDHLPNAKSVISDVGKFDAGKDQGHGIRVRANLLCGKAVPVNPSIPQ
jgi:hypothetical protein